MNRTRLTALLSLAVFVLLGCSRNPGDLEGTRAPSEPPRTSNWTPGEDYFALLESLDYEEITGTLNPGSGGAMGMNLTTWPRNCFFGMVVSPEALDPLGDPIQFTMRIPTYASYLAHPEIANKIIVRLDPDGTNFLGPISIYTTWMPWAGPIPELEFYYIYPDGHGGVGQGDVGIPTVEFLPDLKRWRVVFQVTHFSDWEAGRRLPPL